MVRLQFYSSHRDISFNRKINVFTTEDLHTVHLHSDKKKIRDNTIEIIISLDKSALFVTLQFWLSELTLCKEIAIIVKTFDFKILTHLHTLWGLLNLFMLFLWWCEHVCVCACMWVNTIAFKRCIRMSLNLVRML